MDRYSGGRDGRICAWDLHLPQTGKPSVSDDREPSGQTPRTRRTTLRWQIWPHIHWVNDIALIPDGTALVSASSDLNVKLWPHPYSQTGAHTLGQHADYVKRIASPPAGAPGANQWIASGGLDRKIHVWDLGGKGSILEIDTGAEGVRQKRSVYALAVGPNMIASGGPDRIVTLWDPRSGKKINSLIGHTDMIRDVMVSASADTLVSASSDTTVKVWSTQNYRCTHTLAMHESSVWSLYSDERDLRTFYSGDRSGLVAKTRISFNYEQTDDTCSIGMCREDEGVVGLVAHRDHIWTATSRSSIVRWPDGGSAMVAFPESSYLDLSMAPRLSCMSNGSGSGSGVPPLHSVPEETIEGVNGVVRSCLLKDRHNVLTVDTAGEVAMWDILQVRECCILD